MNYLQQNGVNSQFGKKARKLAQPKERVSGAKGGFKFEKSGDKKLRRKRSQKRKNLVANLLLVRPVCDVCFRNV
jgi:hypothetical protein